MARQKVKRVSNVGGLKGSQSPAWIAAQQSKPQILSAEASREKFWKEYKDGQKAFAPPEQHPMRFPVAEIVEEISRKYKLTTKQCEFLLMRLNFSTDSDCADYIGVGRKTVQVWKYQKSHWDNTARDSTKFYDAYVELMARQKRAAEDAMNSLLYKAVVRTDELLDAEKVVVRKGEEIGIPDHQLRAKGVEIVSRWGGKWSEANVHEENNVYVNTLEAFNKLIRAKTEVLEGEVRELGDSNSQ